MNNELMINLLLSLNVKQFKKLITDSEISLESETIYSLLRIKELEDGVEVHFVYKTENEDLYTSQVSVIVEDNELHLEF